MVLPMNVYRRIAILFGCYPSLNFVTNGTSHNQGALSMCMEKPVRILRHMEQERELASSERFHLHGKKKREKKRLFLWEIK